MSYLVNDVSKYQGKIDFNKYSLSKSKGMIIRCGYRGYAPSGILVTDEYFFDNVSNCDKYCIPYGVYFFSQAITTDEAKKEAEYTIDLIKKTGVNPEFPIYIDTEYSNTNRNGRADKLTKPARTAIVKAFCDRIEELGYYAGIYASTSWFNTMLNDAELKNYDHWIADYRGYCGYKGNYGMWQYTSTEKIDGIAKNCDHNYCYKHYPYIISNAGLNGFKKR